MDPWNTRAKHQSLHHIVAKSEWSDEAVLARVREWVMPGLKLAQVTTGLWMTPDSRGDEADSGPGTTQGETAQRLSVPKGMIANWVAAARHGRGPVSGAKTAQELEREIARLRKELAEVKQEREVLKKGTLPGNRSKVRVCEALVQGVCY